MNQLELETQWMELISDRHRKLRKLGKVQRRIDRLEREIKEHQEKQRAMFNDDDDQSGHALLRLEGV